MPWGYAAVAAAGIGSAVIGSDASKSAAGSQANAANSATALQEKIFNTEQTQNAPFLQTGTAANQKLANLLGIGNGVDTSDPRYTSIYNALLTDANQQHQSRYGVPLAQSNDPTALKQEMDNLSSQAAQQFTSQYGGSQTGQSDQPGGFGSLLHQFNANDLQTNLAPNYLFQLEQGQGAARNAGNLQTGLLSGNTMKGLEDYTQNFAGNAYQQAYNNFNQNQTNIYNRLSTAAGMGQVSAGNSQTGASTLAGGISNTIQGAGAAQAAGTVGSANAISGGLSNAAGWYALSNLNQPQTGNQALNTNYQPPLDFQNT